MTFFKEPKNTKNLFWTKHAKEKMRYYQLSENRLKRVLRNPKRIEEGIAPDTIAIMQPAGTKKHPTEIWLIYQIKSSKVKGQKSKIIKIISAWRYPGISPIGEPPPIPEDVLKDLKEYVT
jgi:hypothetical protein